MSSCLSKFSRPVGALALTLAALLPASAFSAVLASQAPEDAGLSFSTSVTVGLQNGDAFSLAGNSTVNTLQWWGTSADATGFVVRLFDSAAAAAAPIFECGDSLGLSTCMGAVSGSATGLADSAGDGISAFSIDLAAPLSLGAGTYLLAISNELEDWRWLASAVGDGVGSYRAADDEAWSEAAPDFSFAVIGERDVVTVPEPGTLALLSAVLFVAGVGRSRRRSMAA
ncbi:MAG: PEP-CTERM sorting domain-containing protein [Rhodocyclaceae bacterium]|nr:PEP-CTERM sorting domain-containing protein [Rhodocyclaceae bacterium]MCB1913042.1 PEP-CTERM sorting domain-containing protein [Rhodocyclaceae bacterium]